MENSGRTLDHIKGQPQNWRYNFDTTMNNLKQYKNDQTIESDRTIQTDSSRISSCDMGDYIGSTAVLFHKGVDTWTCRNCLV